jgi:hypothetical protein
MPGSATTLQLMLFDADVLQPVPVAVRRLSIRFVPVIAAKFGTLVPHPLHVLPLSVEFLYWSVIVPVPPLPAVVFAVNVAPSHTAATFGFFVNPGATGSATTFQLMLFDADVLQFAIVAARRLSIRFVPVTAAKFGTLVPHPLHVLQLSVEYLY